MGKQQRSRRSRQFREKSRKDSSLDGKSPALLQRLRHGDEGTRQAALAALQLNPSLLHTSSTSSSRLLETVRDQLVGNSLVVATQACEVMIAYLSSSSINEDVASSWMPLLTQRLLTCQNWIRQSSATEATPAHHRQTIEFASKCLECLAVLTEVNPLAMKRILRVQVDLLNVLSCWLDQQLLGTSKTKDATEKVTELACRCLHSVLDDNRDLVIPWFDRDLDQHSQPRETLNALHSILSKNASDVEAVSNSTSIVRLHAAGAWLAIWRFIPVNTQSNLIALLQSQLERCVRILLASLERLSNSSDASANPSILSLIFHLKTIHSAWMIYRSDAMLEKDIIATQNAKNESARSIAQRLKQRAMESASTNDGSSIHRVEPDEATFDQPASYIDSKPQNGQLIWETAKQEWLNALHPFQLSLEILLNLTTAGDSDEDTEAGGDCLMADREEVAPAVNPLLSQCLVRLQAPQLVQSSVNVAASLLANAQPCSESRALPSIVSLSLSELIHKSATLLGHMLANVSTWHPPVTLFTKLQVLFNDVLLESKANDDSNDASSPPTMEVITTIVKQEAAESLSCSYVVVLEGVSNAMVAGLQAHRLSVDELDPAVELFSLALQHSLVQQSPKLLRNLVNLLSLLLCSNPHPIQMNEKVCRALLLVGSDAATAIAAAGKVDSSCSVMLVAEVCDALMDLYGSDDSHLTVFDKLTVNVYMEQMIPLLRHGGEDETVFNTRRFLQYMKQ